jgi:hypothetical protein
MHKGIHIEDEGTEHLAGFPEPSSRPATGSAVILLFPFPPRTAASWAWEEEASGPDTFQSIGSLAIRLVMRTKYPRIWCEVREGELGEESPPSL